MQGHQINWDETKSPQWRYLLSRDNREKREERARRELEELGLNEVKTKRVSKRKRIRQEQKRKNKAGKTIVFSASPHSSGGISRYHSNDELPEPKQNNLKNETK